MRSRPAVIGMPVSLDEQRAETTNISWKESDIHFENFVMRATKHSLISSIKLIWLVLTIDTSLQQHSQQRCCASMEISTDTWHLYKSNVPRNMADGHDHDG